MDILFPHITPPITPTQWKLHLACWNSYESPLDVFVRNRKEWDSWNAWRSSRDDFSREYILGLIECPQQDTWLFGGAYQVTGRKPVNQAHSYTIENLKEWEPLVGRLKVRMRRPARGKAFNLENHYGEIRVSELLPEIYSGQAFVGYDNIDIGFRELETVYAIQKADWKAALENAKGVYLITDRSNGKRYVGSAYGTTGLWARWGCYVATGHGFNDELTRLIQEKGIEHARTNFQIALLEHRTPKTDDSVIIERECYWKTVLLTRQSEYGYNRN